MIHVRMDTGDVHTYPDVSQWDVLNGGVLALYDRDTKKVKYLLRHWDKVEFIPQDEEMQRR